MKSSFVKSVIAVFLILVLAAGVVFLAGRYGWKLFGFSACESAAIEKVEVTDNQVQITGFYPGSFPRGFLGYYAEETDGKLYVGSSSVACSVFLKPGISMLAFP